MKLFPLSILVLLVTGCSQVKPTDGPLQIKTPPEWNVKCQLEQGKNFYHVNEDKKQYYLEFFFAPGMPARLIPKAINKYAKEYADHNDADPAKYNLASDTPVIGEIDGSPFKGNYVDFTLKDGTQYIFFLISDGTQGWEGQFKGPEEGWTAAMEILKGITTKG